jgi:hypothetical protein
MCTVTYLPLPSEGYILTSTRDEKSIRKPAILPQEYEVYGEKVFYPKDPDAGGTWIASAVGGYSLCLLNGGSEIHESRPPYRLSRGLVLLDFFKYNDVRSFLEKYDFQGIEPFTLLIIGHRQRSLDELRWDGQRVHYNMPNPAIPGIWSSVTLYSHDVIGLRKSWFEKWLLKNPGFTVVDAVNFHKNAGSGDIRNDVMMNREGEVRTVSITSVSRTEISEEIYYEDVISGRSFNQNISGNPLLVNI